MSAKSVNYSENVLMDSLLTFFRNPSNFHVFASIVSGTTPISLRLLDFFTTNYSKKHLQGVYDQYKGTLKGYSKKRFDPFCRNERISFGYSGNSLIETTVGQLNFFRWLIQYGILGVIYQNLEDIEHEMHQEDLRRKKPNSRRTKKSRTRKNSKRSRSKK